MVRCRSRRQAGLAIGGTLLYLAVAASCAWGAGWSNEVALGDIHQLGPSVDVSDDGTVRMVKGGPEGRVEVLSLPRGATKPKRCVLPDPERKRVDTLATGIGPKGAVAAAWRIREGDSLRIRAASAAPGRCFGRAKTLSTKGRTTSLGRAIAGSTGTVLVTWREHRGDQLEPVPRFATGAAGGAFSKARGLPADGGVPRDVIPFFIREDRVEWSWKTREGSTTRQWAATSAPRAGKIGKPRQVAKHSEAGGSTTPSPVYGSLLTTSAGGQVAALPLDGALHIWSRKPGGMFAAPQSVAIPPTGTQYDGGSAINSSGDAVFAVEEDDEIYAVVRRRSGGLGELQHLTAGDSPRVAADPDVAIDGTGRAVVVWRAQDASHEQIADSEIRAAVSDAKGRFGPAAVVSKPGAFADRYPYVATDASGRAAIVWTRESGDQLLLHLVRGRLSAP